MAQSRGTAVNIRLAALARDQSGSYICPAALHAPTTGGSVSDDLLPSFISVNEWHEIRVACGCEVDATPG